MINRPENGRGQGHVTNFKIRGPNDICETAETSRQILYTGRLYHVLVNG